MPTSFLLCVDTALRKHTHATDRFFLRLFKLQFSVDLFYYFHIFAQNIDCGYTLEPPH